MRPKSIIRTGYLFLILGIAISAFLIYQMRRCPDEACAFLLIYLSLIALAVSIVIFILLYMFGMHIWLGKKYGKR